MSADMESDHEEKRLKKSKRKHRNEEETSDKMDVEETPKATDSAKKDKKKHKEKKRKERSEDVENDEADVEPAASPEKKHKKHKSADEKKEKKHSSEQPKSPSSQLPERPAKQTTGTHGQAAVPPKNREYPFFTQTFSQRVPIWPASFDEPLTKTAREYLDPMLNRYSPKFKGVLLEYKNVNLSHRPQRADPKNPPTDDTPVLLQSVECYAPPFAWLTADLHLFIPSRGAWMEGEINLQSEGHIGVLCFEKFNASISRRSLPKGWTWVDQPDEDYVAEEEAPAVEEDPFTEKAEGEDAEGAEVEGGNTARDTHQLRSSGHWVDENGDRVSGKVHFRIKNFSSGSTGDFTYLSLQGTMLDDESEKKAVAEERELEKARRARQNPSGLLYPTMRLPEFSMTKLKDDLV